MVRSRWSKVVQGQRFTGLGTRSRSSKKHSKGSVHRQSSNRPLTLKEQKLESDRYLLPYSERKERIKEKKLEQLVLDKLNRRFSK